MIPDGTIVDKQAQIFPFMHHKLSVAHSVRVSILLPLSYQVTDIHGVTSLRPEHARMVQIVKELYAASEDEFAETSTHAFKWNRHFPLPKWISRSGSARLRKLFSARRTQHGRATHALGSDRSREPKDTSTARVETPRVRLLRLKTSRSAIRIARLKRRL